MSDDQAKTGILIPDNEPRIGEPIGTPRYGIECPVGEWCEISSDPMTDLPPDLEPLEDRLRQLIGESNGVAGYHQNGEVASWGEIVPIFFPELSDS